MPSTKKKRVSKKTKQSWRKHVDIKDVEGYLEDKRADERLGEAFESLSDKALFQVDTKPFTKSQISKKEKESLDAIPRCFQLLQPLTKVPDPISKRNRVRTKEERQSTIRMPSKEMERKQRIQKAKDKLAERNRARSRVEKEARKNKFGEFHNDIWHVDFNPVNAELHNEWFSTDTIRHTYRGLSKLRKRIPESLTEKQTILPTVEMPHPGMSYNPSFNDHQALLREIADKEYKIIKDEKHIERVTSRMFRKTTLLEKEQSWLVEMSEGLPKPGDKNDDSDGEFKSVNPPVRNKKKDRKQRRKQKEQHTLALARRSMKQEKKKISDIYRLRAIKTSIEKRDEKIKQFLEKREKVKEEYKMLEPKRLGSNKFEVPDLEFQMGADIVGNLRSLKPEGNLLRDRFVSMQKRNILEPTVKQPPKKRAKVKRYEKSGHKMGWESKGY